MEALKLSDVDFPPFELSLRIRHPSMDPQRISEELQLEARHSFKAGEPRPSHSGTPNSSVHTESYWLGTLEPMTMPLMAHDLDAALAWCARHVLRTHADFMRRMRTEGGQVHLLVTLPPQSGYGFTLTPDLGRTLGELGIAINFEFAHPIQ
jgi:hypothetical protein